VAFVALVAAAFAAGAESAKRPVTAPGSQPPPPPPVVEPEKQPVPPAPSSPGAPAAAAEAAPAGKLVDPIVAPETKPVPPPPAPSAFKDERAPVAAPAAPKAVDPDPRELKYRKKTGDVMVAMAVRPGKPKPATPVEVAFQLDELLAIPDPVLGDRRPVEKERLIAHVTGPSYAATFEMHRLADKGAYGFHFTPATAGLYNVTCDRANGKPGLRTEFSLGVGVETPVPTDNASDPNLRKGPRGARNVLGADSRRDEVKGPDDSTAAGVMDELGRDWMALRRAAGTPEAAVPMGKVLDGAKKLAGKTPEGFPESRAEFDRLAAKFVADLEALKGQATTPAATAEMDRLQTGTCLRCHAQFRYGVAQSVERWPDFDKRQAPAVQPAAGKKDTKRKLPVGFPVKE
jgi:hypothetical protein